MEKESWQRFPTNALAGASQADLEAFVAGLTPGAPVIIMLEGVQWGPRAGETLAAIPAGVELRFLCIRGTLVGDPGLAALANSPALGSVRTLLLERCGLTDATTPALFSARPLPKLTGLHLGNRQGIPAGPLNHLTDLTALTLANSTALPSLQELDLWNTSVGDAGWEAIANSPNLAKLQSAYAWGTGLTAECAQKIKGTSYQRLIATSSSGPPLSKCWYHTDYDERTISWTEDA